MQIFIYLIQVPLDNFWSGRGIPANLWNTKSGSWPSFLNENEGHNDIFGHDYCKSYDIISSLMWTFLYIIVWIDQPQQKGYCVQLWNYKTEFQQKLFYSSKNCLALLQIKTLILISFEPSPAAYGFVTLHALSGHSLYRIQ